MSCSLEFSPKSSPINTTNNFSSSSQSYNDLINYCSIRKQFFRIIPQYMNINNKKLISQKKSSSNIEEYRKYKQEIISLKESIALLKEKKQKKLEQIEELRCLMRKVGNKQYNNYSKNNNINNYHHDRETKEQRNNDQRFRCNPNNDKKQQCCFDTTKGTSEDVEGGLSLMPSTSGISSGKDEDTAPEGGNYPEQDNQSDFILSNSSSINSICNSDYWRCCFAAGNEKADSLKGLEGNGSSSLLEKEN